MSNSFRSASATQPARTTDGTDREEKLYVAETLAKNYKNLQKVSESETYLFYTARPRNGAGSPASESAEPVILKVLSRSATCEFWPRKLFQVEALAASSLSHENILKGSEVKELDGIHFQEVSHRPDAQTLRHLLDHNGWLDVNNACQIMKQVAAAVDYAHQKGVLHLCLCPEKILLAPEGTVLLAGFGVDRGSDFLWAHQMRSRSCAAEYVSPEAAQGVRPGRRSDLYSLGVILYEMLTDRVPFGSSDPGMIHLSHMTRAARPPHLLRPDLPESLSGIILTLLKKNPGERLADAGTLHSLLDRVFPLAPSESASPSEDVNRTAFIKSSEAEASDGGDGNAVIESHAMPDNGATDDLGHSEDDQRSQTQALGDLPAHAPAPGMESFADPDYEAPPLRLISDEPLYGPPDRACLTSDLMERPRKWLRWGSASFMLIIVLALTLWLTRSPHLRAIPISEASEAERETGSGEGPKSSPPQAVAAGPEVQPALLNPAINSSGKNELADKPARRQDIVVPPAPVEPVSRRAAEPPMVDRIDQIYSTGGSLPEGVGGALPPSIPLTEAPPPVEAKATPLSPPSLVRQSSDVFQNSAIKRVQPIYPEAAKSTQISGPVTVEVVVSEEGSPIVVRAISGPEPLRQAAEAAARGWKWMPTKVDRRRVRVVGTVTFRFNK